jgi:DNA-binding transcriptional regulator YiaG
MSDPTQPGGEGTPPPLPPATEEERARNAAQEELAAGGAGERAEPESSTLPDVKRPIPDRDRLKAAREALASANAALKEEASSRAYQKMMRDRVGQQIRAARRALNMTGPELARKANVNKGDLSRLETSAERPWSEPAVHRILGYLNKALEELEGV